MKIKSAGAVVALPPLRTVNVKKGEPVQVMGIVQHKMVPHYLCIVPRLDASILLKKGRLVI